MTILPKKKSKDKVGASLQQQQHSDNGGGGGSESDEDTLKEGGAAGGHPPPLDLEGEHLPGYNHYSSPSNYYNSRYMS